ncbi:hypothetical protein [Kribbella lupini]|uniref:Secreted protein n=1 Tax=Kribbella lupini TaxID=291602 RepID=A0ABN2CSB0_9ACTN
MKRTLLALAGSVVLLAGFVPGAAATPTMDFCWDMDANFTPAGGGQRGRVNVLAHCEARADSWRIDVYVNGEWWAVGSGGKIPGVREHWLGVDVPSMPKPNDKRGNYVWAKVTYKAGDTWENSYREELGWFPCKSCTR